MAGLAELRRWSLEEARDGRTEADLAEMLFTRGLEDPDLMRAGWREWCNRQAGDAVATAVKPSGRSQRAPAPLEPGQLRLALGELPPLDGLAADRRYFNRYRATVARYRETVERLAIMEPFAAANDLSQYGTYADACRAAGVSDEMVANLSA
jgi:hypothetical protein